VFGREDMRKRYTVILAVIGILFLCYVEGWGADWKRIAITKEKGNFVTYYYLETKKIRRLPDEKIRCWVVINSVPSGTPEPSMEKLPREGFVDYIELECLNDRYRSVRTECEAREGYVLITPIRWENIEPDSGYDKIREFLCPKK
jgi:hypothetical protein